MKAVAIYREADACGQRTIEEEEEDKTTHDDTTTEVLGHIERYSRDDLPKDAGAPGEDGEECARHGAEEDDEDGGDAETSEGVRAAAGAAVEGVVVAARESVRHFAKTVR